MVLTSMSRQRHRWISRISELSNIAELLCHTTTSNAHSFHKSRGGNETHMSMFNNSSLVNDPLELACTMQNTWVHMSSCFWVDRLLVMVTMMSACALQCTSVWFSHHGWSLDQNTWQSSRSHHWSRFVNCNIAPLQLFVACALNCNKALAFVWRRTHEPLWEDSMLRTSWNHCLSVSSFQSLWLFGHGNFLTCKVHMFGSSCGMWADKDTDNCSVAWCSVCNDSVSHWLDSQRRRKLWTMDASAGLWSHNCYVSRMHSAAMTGWAETHRTDAVAFNSSY